MGASRYASCGAQHLGWSLADVSDFLLAHIAAVITFQFAEDDRGYDGEAAKSQERMVDAVNHFPGAVVNASGNEKRRG